MTDDDGHMDDVEATPTPSDAPADPEPANEQDDATEAVSDDVAALRREAAGYRRQLRAAEAERDRLREHLDVRDRADVERLAGQTMASASDLWVAGVELAALRDEEGTLSPPLVEEAVERVLADRPHWRKAAPAPSFDGGARVTPESASPFPFGEALKIAGRP
jgi:hypothetical protein